MLAERLTARSLGTGAFIAVALLVFGAADLRAEITDEQCADAWAESEASATCTDTTAVVDVGDECSIETTCDKEGFPTPASIIRPLEDISELRACLATLTVGPCDGLPPEDPPEPTPQEQCEEAWAESEASATCTDTTAEVAFGNECSIETTCDKEGYPTPASITRPLEDISELRNCLATLTVGPCDEPPPEDPPELTPQEQCEEAFASSPAASVCEVREISPQFGGSYCKVDVDCTHTDGQVNRVLILRSLQDVALLRYCGMGTLSPGECQVVSKQEQCQDAWEESEASATCTDTTVTAEYGDTECGIETTCDKEGFPTPASIIRPLEDISELRACLATLTVGPCPPLP